ncbi:MAG: T9SS type A sorting domain-containing protein [Bacteroidota bacterium]
MKKLVLLLLAITIVAGLIAPTTTLAQLRNVTFVVNTSTVPDTGISSVTVTGDKAAITNWGAGAPLTRIGGDYWSGVVQFNQGDSVRYKIRVNGAWEANLVDPNGLSANDRGLIVGNADTTLPVQFFNSLAHGKPQYFRPWTTQPDTMITIYFRTNMQGLQSKPFNKNTDTVGVRGDKSGGSWGDPGFGWSPTRYMTREAAAANGGFTYDATNFWSGAIHLRKSSVNGGDLGEYKFLIGYDWGRDEQNNRSFRIPADKKDTTLTWVWFNNEAVTPPPPFNDTCVITFRTNMTYAIQRGGFQVGDTIEVHTGYFSTAVENDRTKMMLRQGLTNFYQVTDTVITKLTNLLDYQFYLYKNGNRIRENYFNFDFAGTPGSAEAERRQITVSSNTFTVQDTSSNITAARRQPEFANQTNLTKDVKVTWTVDMRPAYYQILLGGATLIAIQGPDTVRSADSIRTWGVGFNGPATNLPFVFPVGDWASWNRDMVADTNKRKMWDDGPGGGHGDAVAGDSIYSLVYQYTTSNTKGKVFKFGIRGSDNESGFGLNHLENISDADTVFTINAQWGSINPRFYNHWDFNNRRPILTGVETLPGIPMVYTLEQNYPNPFNPSTKIEFSIPTASVVTLKVFNILGQEVATLVNEQLNAGSHRVTFDATKFASGMYLYKITAGTFTSTRKMLLLK